MKARISAAWAAEPVRIIQSVLAVVVAFGLVVSDVQIEAILAVVAAILGGQEMTRRKVSPSEPR